MPRVKKPISERTDEFDWHTPLYDQKEFRKYATEVVLRAVTKKLISRRRVKERLGKKVVTLWIDHALEFLALHGHVHMDVRGEGITYFSTQIPKRPVVKSHKWNGRVSPFGSPVRHRPARSSPDWQDFGNRQTA